MGSGLKALAIHTANMGDVVSSLGVIRAMVGHWGTVDIVLRSPFAGLFAGEPGVREITETQAKETAYDLVVDLDSSRHSRKLIKQIDGKKKIGRYVNLMRRLKYGAYYSQQVPKRPIDHIVKDYSVVGEAMGFSDLPQPRFQKVQLDQEVIQWLRDIGSSGREVVVLAPEASNPIRSLPQELVKGLIAKYREMGTAVVLVGLDEKIYTGFCAEFDGWAHWRSLSMVGLKTLFSEVETFVGCDSGPMHLASAMGMNVIALFGPTRPANYGPPMTQGRFVEKEFSCRPCNQNKPCPYDLRCFKSIAVEDVLGSN